MSRHKLIPADTMPLREALRGLRFMMRRGGETIADTLNVETLPKPASDLASAVLREVEGLARSVDGIASDVVKTVLGGQTAEAAPLQELIERPESDAEFATAFYVAVTAVLRRLGAESVFVSEAAARRVFAGMDPQAAERPTAHHAAELTLRLLEARVIRGTTAEQAARVPGAALEPVSLFAVILWLQSERTDADNESVLGAATDMAVALAGEIAPALAKRDVGQIAALYTKYVQHV